MGGKLELDTEKAADVRGILEAAVEEMQGATTGFGRMSSSAIAGYTGLGTQKLGSNYESLGDSGKALAVALSGLADDLGLSISTGVETDNLMNAEVNQGASAVADVAIVRGF